MAEREEILKWFGDKGRFDLVATNAEGEHRALEFVIEDVELIPREKSDSLTTPPTISFKAKYVGKREPTDAELPDQEIGLPTIEDTGFVMNLAVNDGKTDTPSGDTASRKGSAKA